MGADESEIYCPYCGEINYIDADNVGAGTQIFIQDCEVCCRPIEIKISIDRDGNSNVEVRNDEGF